MPISMKVYALFHETLSFSLNVRILSTMFVLPSKVYLEMKSKLRAFFRSAMDFFSSRVKVAWEDICVPKEKGAWGWFVQGVEPSNDDEAHLEYCEQELQIRSGKMGLC